MHLLSYTTTLSFMALLTAMPVLGRPDIIARGADSSWELLGETTHEEPVQPYGKGPSKCKPILTGMDTLEHWEGDGLQLVLYKGTEGCKKENRLGNPYTTTVPKGSKIKLPVPATYFWVYNYAAK